MKRFLFQAVTFPALAIGGVLCAPMGWLAHGGGQKSIGEKIGLCVAAIPFGVGWPLLWSGCKLLEIEERRSGQNRNFFR